MITGKTPFESDYLSTTIENIEKGEAEFDPRIWNNFSKSSKDLVSRLLKKRNERFTALEAKKHFWFNKKPSITNDLTQSDSLCFKLGGNMIVCSQKYAEDSDQSRPRAQIPAF